MLQAEAGDMVAERQQEVIAAIVARAEQRACFRHQAFILLDCLRRQGQSAFAIRRDVNIVRGSVEYAQIYGLIVRSRGDWRIDQGLERSRLELNFIARLLRDGERRSEVQ